MTRSRFPTEGFLADEAREGVPHIRSQASDWFRLAEDINAALMQVCVFVNENPAGKTNWSPKSVASRILLRSCQTFQAVILITERGMVTEGRLMVRSLFENSFCVGALIDNPTTFIDMIRSDAEASRRNQGRFIIAQGLGEGDVDREKLKAAIDAIDSKAKIMSPKKVAELGPLLTQYLNYQRLSDDAAHVSAQSLHRHVAPDPDGPGWSLKWEPGSPGENAATMHQAILAALSIGIAVCQLYEDRADQIALTKLAERFRVMPPVPLI